MHGSHVDLVGGMNNRKVRREEVGDCFGLDGGEITHKQGGNVEIGG